jgi:hypothetical protein
MIGFKILVGALALGAAMAAVPAQAVVSTFASYSPIGSAKNVRWVLTGSTEGTTKGTFFSTATGSSNVAGSREVFFSLLQPGTGGAVTNVIALFSLNAATTAGTVATISGAGNISQNTIAGTMSFLSTAPLTVNGTVYAAGSNLLTATFSQTQMNGARNSTSAGFTGSTTSGSTLFYTSDFLDFSATVDRDFALGLTSVAAALDASPTSATPTRALRTFRAVTGGTFSSDPAALVNGIPEPEMWAMMVIGFGLVGVTVRSRSKKLASVAA